MADETFVELLRLGPFTGVDYTSSDSTMQPGYADSASGANPTRQPGALLCERGRVQTSFDGDFDDITMIYPCVGRKTDGFVIVQGTRAGTPKTVLYDISGDLFGYQDISNAQPFTQAVQYGEVVYTNTGQRFFLNPLSLGSLQFYDWQYPAPTAYPGISLSPGVSGSGQMASGTYYYVVTRQTIMPDNTVSETSVDLNQYQNPPSTIVTGPSGSVTIKPILPFQFTGQNDDGTTFTTNLYRQSSNQAGYLLVANLTTNNAYTDTASDISLLSNASLEVSRDPPPCTVKHPGWLAIHNSSVWVFLMVDTVNTSYVPEVQLWYSNFARPWEFDATSQVLLCQSDVTSAPGSLPSEFYGNEPMGLVEVGTLLLALTRRQTWGIYGESQSDYFQRQLFNIGCVAPYSIMGISGGAYWLSDSGVYFFDGSSPQSHAERFTALLRGLPGWPGSPGLPGIPVADQLQACSSFYNLTYYLHFPTLQQTYGFHAPSSQWLGVLPYAPRYPQTLSTIPANPTTFDGITWNEVLAARAGEASLLDWYFADESFDLGQPQSVTWNGPTTFGPDEGAEKQYRYITLTGPIEAGSATVTLTVDPGSGEPNKTVVWNVPDLTQGDSEGSTPGRQIKAIGFQEEPGSGLLRGFSANLSVTLTGAAGQPAPQLWSVVAWGSMPPQRRLVKRT